MTLPERVPRRPGYELTIHRVYRRALDLFPRREIVYRVKTGSGDEYRVERYTVADMARRVEALAAALEELGVGRLDRVATLDWNTHWHLETYFAAPMMGAVLHPVNIRLAPSEIAYVMRQAGDKVAVINSDFLPLVEKIAPSVPSLKAIVVVDEAAGHPDSVAGVPVYSYEDLLGRHLGGGYGWPSVEEDQPAAMGYTSGTTGLPKGVYHSHRQLVLHTLSAGLALAASSPHFQVSSADTILHIVPMFHVYSWGLPYLATMLGMKQVYPNKLDPGNLLELIDTEGVTLTAGVPTILYMLLTHPRARETRGLRGLKYINGGSALPRGLAEQAAKLGIRLIVGYGMTETAPVLTLAVPPGHLEDAEERWLDYALRTGWPVPLVDLMVADEELRPVPRDGRTMGEVVVRAPWVTYEYYMAPDKTEEAWRGGWFHTGDIGVWYPDGSLVLMDRLKDVVKSGGEWISTTRLEDAISRHPCVAQVAVIGVYHPKWQERPIAVIVPKPGCEDKITTEEIRGFLTREFVEKGEIPKWWLPDRVVVAEELPRTSVGKVDKRRLRQQYHQLLTEEP